MPNTESLNPPPYSEPLGTHSPGARVKAHGANSTGCDAEACRRGRPGADGRGSIQWGGHPGLKLYKWAKSQLLGCLFWADEDGRAQHTWPLAPQDSLFH